MATWLQKVGKWGKKNASSIAKIALPLAGVAAGLVAPGVGAAIGKLSDKIGNKIKDVSAATGIGDGKPGVFGIGDGLPGVFGIGDGSSAAKKQTEAVQTIETIKAKVKGGITLTAPEVAALAAHEEATTKKGVNPLYLVLGGVAALFALRR